MLYLCPYGLRRHQMLFMATHSLCKLLLSTFWLPLAKDHMTGFRPARKLWATLTCISHGSPSYTLLKGEV